MVCGSCGLEVWDAPAAADPGPELERAARDGALELAARKEVLGGCAIYMYMIYVYIYIFFFCICSPPHDVYLMASYSTTSSAYYVTRNAHVQGML